MKTPTWGYILGILMLMIGGCSTVSNIQSINTPSVLEMQKKMLKGMAGNIEINETDSLNNHIDDSTSLTQSNLDQKELFYNLSETMETMFYMSDFTKKWTIRFGYIGLVLSFIYMLAGIFLIINKPFSIKLVYSALGLYIAFCLIQIGVFSSDSSKGLLAMTSNYTHIFSIIFDVVILIAILGADKTAYRFSDKKIENPNIES